MKIFITGIAGFIGSALAMRLLSEGHTVTGIDNLSTGIKSNIPDNVNWIKGDIANYKDFEKLNDDYDAIVHTAAQTSGEKSFEMPLYDLDTNIKGSYNTFKFAKKSGSKILINFSSMSVYGNVPNKQITDENYRPDPVSIYGNSKLSAERMLNILSNQDNIPVVSFRLFNAYGPGQNLKELKQGMISIYLAQFLEKKFDQVIVKGSFSRVRDFIYIDDIINILIKVLFINNPMSGIYNLSTGNVTSVSEIINLISRISRIEKKVVSQGETAGDITGFGGNVSLLSKTFGWNPKVDIVTGMTKMINYYLEKKYIE